MHRQWISTHSVLRVRRSPRVFRDFRGEDRLRLVGQQRAEREARALTELICASSPTKTECARLQDKCSTELNASDDQRVRRSAVSWNVDVAEDFRALCAGSGLRHAPRCNSLDRSSRRNWQRQRRHDRRRWPPPCWQNPTINSSAGSLRRRRRTPRSAFRSAMTSGSADSAHQGH